MSLADVLDPMAGCIESESSLDEMNRLCRTVTQYIVEGHRLDSDTKKNMRPLLEKCLTNRWYQQFQTLSHLVYGEDAIWSSEPRYKIATSAWDQVALLDSEAEVVRLQTELFTATQVADMAKALVQTMQRSANSEENALLLEVRVENAVSQAAKLASRQQAPPKMPARLRGLHPRQWMTYGRLRVPLHLKPTGSVV